MSDTPTCAATTRDGSPCHAHPVPGSDFCPFHHPDHAAAFAAGRAQGGATPRRRLRRLPVILDHMHVAELMSELPVDAMNHPDTVDWGRLHALTGVSRVILRAVGTPRRSFLVYRTRDDRPARLPHLLHVSQPTSPEVADLLAQEASAEDPSTLSPSDSAESYTSGIYLDGGLTVDDAEAYLEDARVLNPDGVPVDPREADPPPYPDVRFYGPYAVPPCTDDPLAAEPDPAESATADFAGTDRDFNPGPQPGPQPEEQTEEQALDKPETGAPAVEDFAPDPPDADPPPAAPRPAWRGPIVGCLAGEPRSTIHPSLRDPFRLWRPRQP
jgi:hypothetical protein